MKNTPYDSGYQAYFDGLDIDANPFKDGTDDYEDWESGWVTAADTDDQEGN